MIDINEDELKKIEKNFQVFSDLCKKLGDRSEPVLKMLDELGDRIAVCPASSKQRFHNSFPGGLVEHSLRVLSNAQKLRECLEIDVPTESLIISALFHDFGKVGDLENERYLPQDSDYWRERGNMYQFNDAIMMPPTGQGALYLLQHYGVRLSQEETIAILCNDGMYAQENKPYAMREPDLAILIHHADLWATRQEKKMNRSSL